MKIELKTITLRELYAGYENNDEDGRVVAYGGKLDIRPPYQREFVYKDQQRNEVIRTASKGFPLNVMYWAQREDQTFEVLDGQQRTLSLCEYLENNFSVKHIFGYKDPRSFNNLPNEEQEQLLNYQLTVYFCYGTPKEKLDWFKVVNIAGEKLTTQEIRNAAYAGSWTAAAKRFFSKRGGPAYELGNKYLSGNAIRQDYLETALKWISERRYEKDNIESYLADHQHDADAAELIGYFKAVIHWVKGIFTEYRKEMKGVEWGFLYNRFEGKSFDAAEMEKAVKRLMEDDEVSDKSGVYFYLLTGEEKQLNLRAFSEQQKRTAYEKQNGECGACKKKFDFEVMEADHLTPWREGGKTALENCQILCRPCNRKKGGR